MDQPLYLRPRAYFLDELRGLSVLLMVVHHAAWDLHHLFGVDIPFLAHPLMGFLQALFAGVFVFVSGMVCNISRSNLRRGLLTLLCAFAITVVTAVAVPGQTVRFGVLHLLAAGMLLYGIGQNFWRRCPAAGSFVLASALFVLCWNLPNGYLGWGSWRLTLPAGWYRFPVGFVFGLPEAGFSSGDYFPLIPWIFLFFAGSFAGRPVFQQKRPAWLFRQSVPPLAWVGRHTLWIYLLHQPLLFGLMQLLFQ